MQHSVITKEIHEIDNVAKDSYARGRLVEINSFLKKYLVC